MKIVPLLFLSTALAGAAGCAGTAWCGLQDYKPLVLATTAPHKRVLDAAYQAARQAGATHVDLAEDELRVSATFDEQERTRERLRIQVSEWGQVSVDVRTEMRGAGSEWVAPERVCGDYQHSREQAIADTILAALKSSAL